MAKVTKTINLEKYIEFASPTKSLDAFSGVNFHFNSQIIAKIHQAKHRGYRLQISRQLQTNLRCCSLIGQESYFQSGLSVCSYYRQDKQEEPVIKSLISPEGGMVNQVSSYYLDRHQLCNEITTAHYWLVQQLTQQLAWQQTRVVDILSWLLAIGLVGGLILVYPQGIFTNIVALAVVVVGVLLLQKLLKTIISLGAVELDQWAIAWFLSLGSSPHPWQQQLAKFFLEYLVI